MIDIAAQCALNSRNSAAHQQGRRPCASQSPGSINSTCGGRDDGMPVAGLRGSPRSMLLRSTPDGFGGGPERSCSTMRIFDTVLGPFHWTWLPTRREWSILGPMASRAALPIRRLAVGAIPRAFAAVQPGAGGDRAGQEGPADRLLPLAWQHGRCHRGRMWRAGGRRSEDSLRGLVAIKTAARSSVMAVSSLRTEECDVQRRCGRAQILVEPGVWFGKTAH
jgi:hypothetical protein